MSGAHDQAEDLYCGDCMRFDAMPIAALDGDDPLMGRCPYRDRTSALDEPCDRMVPYRTVLALAGGPSAVAEMSLEEAQECVRKARKLLKSPGKLGSLHPEEVSQMLRAGLFFRERLAQMREQRAKGNAAAQDGAS